MGTYATLKSSWNFVDSPWDMLISCEAAKLTPSLDNSIFCAFSTIMGAWSAYVFPILSTIGITCNILIVYVFLHKLKERTRQNLYFAVLAIADSCNLICSGWLWIFLAKGLPYASLGRLYFFTYNAGELACKLHRYFTASISCAAISIFLLASIDRCCAIFWPLKFMKVPARRALHGAAAVVIASFVFMVPFGTNIGYSLTGTNLTICWIVTQTNEIPLAVFLSLYNILFSFCGSFQTVSIILVNSILFYQVTKGSRLRNQMAANTKGLNKEISACVLILVLSFIFTISSLPTSVSFVLAFLMQYDTSPGADARLRFVFNIGDIGWHLYMVQQCTNGMVYYWKIHSFRRQINGLFCPWRRDLNSKTISSVSTN